MKVVLLFLLGCITSLAAFSQNVGIGTATPHPSAKLDVTATDKGVLVPRLTTAQRSGITAPALGLLVFDSTTKTFWFYNGASWINLMQAPFTLPYTSEATTGVPAFSIKNNGAGAGIRGFGTTGPGVYGYAQGNGLAGVAVRAENTNAAGIGVWSITNSSDANMVVSNSGSGDIFRGFSGPGAGNLVYRVLNNGTLTTWGNVGIGSGAVPTARLEVNGNVKIADGTQGINKVLTSDAGGSASWKSLPGAVAFRALNFSTQNLPANADVQVATTLEDFDLGNNFLASGFTAPSTGIYHFDAKVNFSIPVTENQNYLRYFLQLRKNGTVVEEFQLHNVTNDYTYKQSLPLTATIALATGDVVTVWYSADANPGSSSATIYNATFSGYKVN